MKPQDRQKERKWSQKSRQKTPKGGVRPLGFGRLTDLGAQGPPGAPSRARGILDKSNKERIKNRFVDLWTRCEWFV